MISKVHSWNRKRETYIQTVRAMGSWEVQQRGVEWYQRYQIPGKAGHIARTEMPTCILANEYAFRCRRPQQISNGKLTWAQHRAAPKNLLRDNPNGAITSPNASDVPATRMGHFRCGGTVEYHAPNFSSFDHPLAINEFKT